MIVQIENFNISEVSEIVHCAVLVSSDDRDVTYIAFNPGVVVNDN